ncbi:FmdB family zinc ribbon protein, partial [Parasutterella excrementihominis]|uniref:FmdB family zinc ribbon protein n=1 Tax=Parasutterella excrementihominis TaxID=487175 RepID=UPI003AB6DBA6
MPIYSYKCSNCGYTKDVLQKYSDAPITHCPKCNMETMVKQLCSNLQRKLKGLTGMPPNDYIRLIRLKTAGELLREG